MAMQPAKRLRCKTRVQEAQATMPKLAEEATANNKRMVYICIPNMRYLWEAPAGLPQQAAGAN